MDYVKKLACHLLVVAFAVGSWATLNGVFVELPILTQELPEGWRFPTYITVISQLANIGPIVFTLLQSRRCANERCAIHVVLAMGIAASFITIFVWRETVFVGNVEYSVPLLTLVFFMALVGCTAVVVFPPYIATFAKPFLISMVLGEGLSGLIPGLVAIGQGIQETQCRNITSNVTINGTVHVETKTVSETSDPRFSTSVFFGILFILMVLSEISFIILRFLPAHLVRGKTRQDVPRQSAISEPNEKSPLATGSHQVEPAESTKRKMSDPASSDVTEVVEITYRSVVWLLLQQSWLACLSNTALPSLQSFSCIPYGLFVYHLSATLSSIASPLGTFFSFFLKLKSIKTITALVMVVTVLGCYIAAIAALSPTPPQQDTALGKSLMVFAWVTFSGGAAFAKVNIASFFRHHGQPSLLFNWGVATQVGSFVGAFLTFFLVNFTDIFQAEKTC